MSNSMQFPFAFLSLRLRRLSEALQAHANALAQISGVNVPADLYRELFLLAGSDVTTVGDLAEAVEISLPAMTENLRELVNAGLVHIREDQLDNRRSIVALTDAGRDAVARGRSTILPLVNKTVGELVSDLSGPIDLQIGIIEERLSASFIGDSAISQDALQIRIASDDDLPQIVSLLNRAYRENNSLAAWTNEVGIIAGDRISLETLTAQIAETSEGRMMIFKSADAVNGCVWLEPTAHGVWYLGSLAVDPDLQNARLGRRLLSAAENYVRRHGGRRIEMTVIDRRETLIAWYERRGYHRTGVTEPFPEGDVRFGTPVTPGLRFETLSKIMAP